MKTIFIELLTLVSVVAISFGFVIGAIVLFALIGRILGAS